MTKRSSNAPAFLDEGAAPDNAGLAKLRDGVRAIRDAKLDIVDKEGALSQAKQHLYQLERVALPDMFNEAGVSSITIEAEGNLPAYVAKKSPYYKAAIAAKWDDEKREAAFKELKRLGGDALIKTEITILLPLDSVKLTQTVLSTLRKLKVDFSVQKSVPWAALTSFVKECYEKTKKRPNLDLLGADVGEIVKLKEGK